MARRLLTAIFSPRRKASKLNSERWALTKLGYAYGSRRSIEVSPVQCPVRDSER